MRAVRQIEIERCAAIRGEIVLRAAQDGHVAAAKTVDALLAIADEEEARRARGGWHHSAQRVNDAALAVIGVLKFVHQDRPRLRLPLSAHRRVSFQQRDCPRLQIVEIQGAAFRFQRVVRAARFVERATQGRKRRRGAFVERPAWQRVLRVPSTEPGIDQFVVGFAQSFHCLFCRACLARAAAQVHAPQREEFCQRGVPIVRRARGLDARQAFKQCGDLGGEFVTRVAGKLTAVAQSAQRRQRVERGGRIDVPGDRLSECGLPNGEWILRRVEGGLRVQPLGVQRRQQFAQRVFFQEREQSCRARVVRRPRQRGFDGLRAQRRARVFVERSKIGIDTRFGGMSAQDRRA